MVINDRSAAQNIDKDVYGLYAEWLGIFQQKFPVSDEEQRALNIVINDLNSLHRSHHQVYEAREAYVSQVFPGSSNETLLDNPRRIPYEMLEKTRLHPDEVIPVEHTLNQKLSQFFQPIEEGVLQMLNKSGRAVIPAGFTSEFGIGGHNIIAEIRKMDDKIYTVTEYNAGYDAVPTNKLTGTNEDIRDNKIEVFAQKKWTITLEDPSQIAEKLLPIIDLYFHREIHGQDCYPDITKRLDGLRETLTLGGEIHVQDVNNCSTRTCREYIRAHLPPKVFLQFMEFIQSTDTQKALQSGRQEFLQTAAERYLSEYNPHSDLPHSYRA